MPWVGFEPTIPVVERAKPINALDRKATVIGTFDILYLKNCEPLFVVNITLQFLAIKLLEN
jgi:hypothetical protein